MYTVNSTLKTNFPADTATFAYYLFFPDIGRDSPFAAGAVAAFESGLRRVSREHFHRSRLKVKRAPGYHPHFRGS